MNHAGEKQPAAVDAVLAAGDRSLAGATAPAAFLTLEHVEYDQPWSNEPPARG